MANSSFDDLLQALQWSLVVAQGKLRTRRREWIQKSHETGEGAGSRSPFFLFAIPQQNSADGEVYEMLSLPASSFHTHQRTVISMLALEFECELKERKLSAESRQYELTIKNGTRKWWHQKKRLRMQILFSGSDQPSGEVRIEDKLLLEIPAHGLNSGTPITTENRSRVATILNKIWNRCRANTFRMTEEQSERVREILTQ